METTVEGGVVLFYPEAEAVLEKLPHRGIPMILREIRTRNGVAFKPYSYSGFEKLIQNLRTQIEGVPSYFTLDACRHGGMTELGDSGVSEQGGMSLTGHSTPQALRLYVKRTEVQRMILDPAV